MEKEELEHRTITVYGNVQGVFYRTAVKKAADTLNIQGYAKNARNGTVHIEAEGLPEDMETFLDRCREGSEMSFVKRLKIREGDVVGYNGFDVR